MRTKIILSVLLFSLSIAPRLAAQTPMQLKYKIWDLHALRYFPFAESADSIIYKVLENIPPDAPESETKHTLVDITSNQELLNAQRIYSGTKNDWFNKLLFKPYRHWFDQMELIDPNKKDVKLNVLASGENYCNGKQEEYSYEGIFEFPDNYTITKLASDVLGQMNIYKKKNDVGLGILSGPLAKEAIKDYRYFLSDQSVVDGIPCYEVAFFSKKKHARTTEGLLYIDKETYLPVKAELTLNFSLPDNYVKNILMTHYFKDGNITRKETLLFLGDDMMGSIVVSQTHYYDEPMSDLATLRPFPDAPSVTTTADSTRAWHNLNYAASILLTEYMPIGAKPKVEWGPVLQTVSYNKIEGLRLRLGLNTTARLNKHFTAGGYVAYGTKDERFKYRGDLHYSFTPKHYSLYEFPASLISFSYVYDLNIPGQDLLSSTRDNLFNSLYHSSIKNMSEQKMGKLSYRQEFRNRFSFEVSGKCLSDTPEGLVQYQPFTTAEAGLSLRYAPNEKTIQLRDQRKDIRLAGMEIELNHRIGIKGVFGSDFDYHITTLSVKKQFSLPSRAGNISLALSGGKVWDRIPFPLLFIPQGNQSYVIDDESYNLMRFYEFVTDQYVAGNLNMQFNWSPVSLFLPKLRIRTNVGFKALYGPLSDKNNPELHASLPPLNGGVKALGDDPYMEASIGFSNILRIFRIEYVRRLSYLKGDNISKGSLFIGAGFSF